MIGRWTHEGDARDTVQTREGEPPWLAPSSVLQSSSLSASITPWPGSLLTRESGKYSYKSQLYVTLCRGSLQSLENGSEDKEAVGFRGV